MKKLLVCIITFLLLITSCYAKEEMVINELSITNATISPKFDKYNNYYSVTIDKNLDSLDFNYLFDNTDKYDVRVDNNSNLVQNKYVYATIYDKETNEKNTYVFKVYIDDEEKELQVFNENNDKNEINVKKKNKNYAPIIGTVCFLLIIFVFKIMFL